MTTIDKNALYFRQAAHHLGEREAERHLIIARTGGSGWYEEWGEDTALDWGFIWDDTPQGHDFWRVIYVAALRDNVL